MQKRCSRGVWHVGKIIITLAYTLVIGAEPDISLKNYDISGQYEAELSDSVQSCMEHLKNRQKQSQKGVAEAVVFDIDETILSNITLIRKNKYVFTKKHFVEQVVSSEPRLIEPTHTLFRFLKANHIDVFFITGRTEDMCEVTIKHLQAVGIPPDDYNDIFCAPDDDTAKFKQKKRDEIVAMGYEIIMSISDQEKDLQGSNLGIICKLPNPFYIT